MIQLFGWVNLFPDQIVVDEDILILTISSSARTEALAVHPRKELALRSRRADQVTHRVHAELPPGTVFEVVGRVGMPGDSFPYRVGLFADYADAFDVAGSVNINGARGHVRLVFDYEPVHRSISEYNQHRRRPRYTDQAYYLHSVVEITNDPSNELAGKRADDGSLGR
jgi:hypothetical protein